ncbi:glycosyltransferase [Nonomuraea sp. NPDC050643]|uniref:glycosyltransferase n=1 Tax=Nonomuraea sp. NPDC050643 TaxID=3155660 RepID=UPI0033D0C9E6
MTHGTDGDVLPFVRLGRVLRGRGHEVTLLTHAPYRRRAETAGLGFVPIDTPETYDRYLADSALLPGARGTLSWLDFYRRNALFDQLALECRALSARIGPGRTVLVGRHTSALSVLVVRELLGIPAAWVAVAPIQPMAAGVARHLHQHVLASGIDAVRDGLGLAPVADWPSWFASADLHLGLWPRWFDQAGPPSSPRLRLTGFPHPDEPVKGPGEATRPEPLPAEVAGLLRGPVRPVLVTGGTGRMLHEGFYEAAVAGCHQAGSPVLLVTPHRDLIPHRGLTPDRDLTPHHESTTHHELTPPGVMWQPRLPFAAVMPEVAAVVHHGGIGTLTRALVSGSPQVILAHGADRPDNAARLAAEGLARWLPETRWSPEEVARTLTAALQSGSRTDPAAALQDSLRPALQDTADGLTEAAEHLESLLDRPAPHPFRTLAGLPADQRRVLAARLRRRRAERGTP